MVSYQGSNITILIIYIFYWCWSCLDEIKTVIRSSIPRPDGSKPRSRPNASRPGFYHYSSKVGEFRPPVFWTKFFHYLGIKYRLTDLSENVKPDVYNVLN